MGRMSDLYIEKLENMTEEEQIKYEQEQAEADMAEARYLEECEKKVKALKKVKADVSILNY